MEKFPMFRMLQNLKKYPHLKYEIKIPKMDLITST